MAAPLAFTRRSDRSMLSEAHRAPVRRDLSSHANSSRRIETWTRPHWAVILFLFGLAVPWIIPLGPLNLSVYRLVLLAFLLPCLFSWMRGSLGFCLPDLAVFLYAIWAGVALFAAHDTSAATQTAGIFFIETVGAYLLARCYIRDVASFRGMVLVVTMVVLVLSPFAFYEWVTGNKPILSTLGTIFPTVEITTMVPRWGFWRVQGPFSHSIEFGLFCTSILALTHLAWGHDRSFASRWFLTALVAGTTLFSMSSAPISCLIFQVMLMGYNSVLWRVRGRWAILWCIVIAGFLVVQFGSELGAVKFFISNFTFDPQTGWYRVAIWDFGSASALNHPWLGIGLGDWDRPRWMASDSVDNFWLLTAMRYGIPSLVLLFGCCIWMMVAVARAKGADRSIETCRLAYLICMAMFLFVGITIHFAHAIYAWFMFVLGSGAWMLNAKQSKSARAEGNVLARDRFSHRDVRQQRGG
jgi:O-antigen ligase